MSQKIGFVPTMGALHEGHLSLIKRARAECPVVVVSIFVNPTQFGPQEDYRTYPRNFEQDGQLAAQAGTDILFTPAPEDMYPPGYQTSVEVAEIGQGLCGASRPGHFKGVATVVCKLLNIVMPDTAYFGQKDYQQSLVIKRMVSDLNMDTKVAVLPIIREADGLALSSRNSYLKPEERKAAPVLFQALQIGQKSIAQGEQDVNKTKACMLKIIKQEKLAQLDYLKICHSETLAPLPRITPGKTLLALAVKIGKTRLIDNCLV